MAKPNSVSQTNVGSTERLISLGKKLVPIPERLLLAHARGEVLFIAGAGISLPAGMPDFRGLTLKVYEKIDPAVYKILIEIPRNACNQWIPNVSSLTHRQAAEVKRFVMGDFDVALGMLERRIDGFASPKSSVRLAVAKQIRKPRINPAPIHHALARLANRGGATTIVTTNFDMLLETAAKKLEPDIQTYSLGGIPRPGRKLDFSGILHIHGVLDNSPIRISELILSDQDFGEFYLRRRVVPDFIYDAARLFHLVMIGYSANDPPMRYLLNAVAADGNRFDDLKERFTFVGSSQINPVVVEDWKGRGITPISYDTGDNHKILLNTLKKWADFSAINGNSDLIDSEIKRIVKKSRISSTDADRDLFDHLFRRSNMNERIRLSSMVSMAHAEINWLDAISDIANEHERSIRE
jgi:hypothetical protein